jgi:hypothetical protein
MSVAKLVGYTLLVNVGLVAALDAIHSDDTTARIELGDFTNVTSNIQTSDPPPDEDVEPDVDPALARALAIEEARCATLCGPISSGFENRTFGYPPEIEATPPRRTVSLGRITSLGGLDRATIRRYMNRHIDKIESCYKRELLERPALEGTIVVQFVILPTGSVKDSHGEGFDATVASCVGDVVGNIVFPRPSDGIVQVNYPLTFQGNSTSLPTVRPDSISACARATSANGYVTTGGAAILPSSSQRTTWPIPSCMRSVRSNR